MASNLMHRPLDDGPEDAYAVPKFTEEDVRREEQQLSVHEILDIKSDLLGITTDMTSMSLGVASDISGGSVGQVPAPCSTAGSSTGSSSSHGQQKQQMSSRKSQSELERDINLLDEAIGRMPLHEKAAYLMAVQRCPREVFGGWRWEVFLERRDFDANLTAKSIAEYWTRRHALFGDDRCFLPMTLAGAMQDEVSGMMRYGMHRISPLTDAAGRKVVVVTPSRRVRSLYSTTSQSKAFFYILEVIAQESEARRCGAVMLFHGNDVKPIHFDPRFVKFAVSSMNLFPVPWKAFHFVECTAMLNHIVIPALKFVMGKRMRNRCVTHHSGSSRNTAESLRTYALPPERLPSVFPDGKVVVDIQAWINERYVKEGSDLAAPELELRMEPSSKRIRTTSSPHAGASRVSSTHTSASSRAGPAGNISATSACSSERCEAIESKCPSSSLAPAGFEMRKEEAILFNKKTGRKADPRMNRAVVLKLRDPELDTFEALIASGFNYPPVEERKSIHKKEKDVVDEKGVSLRQRKNQLNRRLKQLRDKYGDVNARKKQSLDKEKSSSTVVQTCNSHEPTTNTDGKEDPYLHYDPAKRSFLPSDVHGVDLRSGTSSQPVPSIVESSNILATTSSSRSQVGGEDGAISDGADSFYDEIVQLPGLEGLEDPVVGR
mmetsp:Transcript_6046/g.12655  ORF Transcript_6046/g.12655 Transcript_6046/m.12655 type:complete len:661 (-) Transcript_6046:84-2066(-)